MVDENKKVVPDTNQRIWQKHFVRDIFSINVAPSIEKSEHELKLDICKCKRVMTKGK